MTRDEFVDLQPSDEISLIGNDGRLRNRVVRNNQARKQPPAKAVSLHPVGKIRTWRKAL